LEDRRNVGESSCNFGDGTDQRVQSLMFMMMMIMMMHIAERFSRNIQISNVMNIHPVGGALFHADGRTDMTRLQTA